MFWSQEFHEPLKSVGDLPSFNYGCEAVECTVETNPPKTCMPRTNFSSGRSSVLKTAQSKEMSVFLSCP